MKTFPFVIPGDFFEVAKSGKIIVYRVVEKFGFATVAKPIASYPKI